MRHHLFCYSVSSFFVCGDGVNQKNRRLGRFFYFEGPILQLLHGCSSSSTTRDSAVLAVDNKRFESGVAAPPSAPMVRVVRNLDDGICTVLAAWWERLD